jgi:phosphotransferase system enzyme I (PtsI)
MTSSKQTNVRLNGIGVSSGIVLGKAFLVDRGKVEISSYHSLRSKEEIEREIKIFSDAIEISRQQLLEAKKGIQKKGYKEASFIIDAYLMLLEDKLIVKETTNYIRKRRINAAWALKNTLKKIQTAFS